MALETSHCQEVPMPMARATRLNPDRRIFWSNRLRAAISTTTGRVSPRKPRKSRLPMGSPSRRARRVQCSIHPQPTR